MTPGDCGSADLSQEQIAAIRREEGRAAAALIGATYHCLEERDLLVTYSESSLQKVTRLMRQVGAQLILTHSPVDYLLDHEMTSIIARAAAFAAAVPNFLSDREMPRPLDHIPHLYYCDPIEGKDALGRDVPPAIRIDISSVIARKEAMLAAHASQREWLLKHHGMDQYLQAMRDWSGHRGKELGVAYAEGYRQHLGHSYPQNNLLGEALGCG
ncbi:MAG: PIG-L family deacetylase [Planctomycetia bacterium]|nr:PIG-L family deacetylase [Planctomycetia bacterium]